MPTAEEFVKKCLAEAGDTYRLGAEVKPGALPAQTFEWDCSELVEVKLRELGIDAPDGSTNQLHWVVNSGTAIPLEEGLRTRGALLLRIGHVAVSLGDGQTIEAKGKAYGVNVFSASHRSFTHAGRVPGLTYSGAVDGVTPTPITDTSNGSLPDLRPTLRRGSVGGSVIYLQKRLLTLGFSPGAVDGDFGPKTEAAVRAFQQSKRLTADGIVGPKTWTALTQS